MLEENKNKEEKELEISKIKLLNGEVYNIKDQYLRDQIKSFLGSDNSCGEENN